MNFIWPEQAISKSDEKPWYSKNHPSNAHNVSFYNIIPRATVKILPPPANVILSLKNEHPAYLNERFKLNLKLLNRESEEIKNLQLKLICKTTISGSGEVLEHSTVHKFFINSEPCRAVTGKIHDDKSYQQHGKSQPRKEVGCEVR